jgi:hypothetical protein
MANINFRPAQFLNIGIGCVIVLFIITLLYAVLRWHDDWRLTREKSTIVPLVTADKNVNTEMIAAIADHHLFGRNLSRTGELPLSNLQIKVTGIVKVTSANDHSFSKVYISVAEAPSKIYQIGDILPSGVKIYNITSQEVILDNEGQLEKLRLSRGKLQFKPRNPLE